jgi:hypothetical protein
VAPDQIQVSVSTVLPSPEKSRSFGVPGISDIWELNLGGGLWLGESSRQVAPSQIQVSSSGPDDPLPPNSTRPPVAGL